MEPGTSNHRSCREQAARLLTGRGLATHPYDPADPVWAAAEDDDVELLLFDLALRTGGSIGWPEGASHSARTAVRKAAALALLRDRELVRLLEIFRSERVECLLIKGAALAHTHYSQPHLRPRADTDLLVRRHDLGRLGPLLHAAGYQQAVETSGDLMTSQIHFDRVGSNPGVHALDVHWKIANPILFADALEFDACADTAASIAALGPHAKTLAPSQALFVACIHRVAHHQDEPTLLWLWDIHLLVTAMSARDRDRFTALAARTRMIAVCARSLELTDAFFQTPGAGALAAELRSMASGDEPSARFIGGMRLVEILSSDLRALAGWRERTVLIREHLFPSRMYMRSRYPRWPSMLLPFAYVHRAAHGATKWLRVQA